MPITGKWRCKWNEGKDFQFIDLGPCDVISAAPVCWRFIYYKNEPDSTLP